MPRGGSSAVIKHRTRLTREHLQQKWRASACSEPDAAGNNLRSRLFRLTVPSFLPFPLFPFPLFPFPFPLFPLPVFLSPAPLAPLMLPFSSPRLTLP